MVFGSFRVRLITDNETKLLRLLKDSRIPLREIAAEEGGFRAAVSAEYYRRLKKLCKSLGAEIEITGRTGLISLAEKLLRHPGMVAGAIVSVPMLIYFSNVVVTLEVQTEDEGIRRDVIQVLKDQGVAPGTYIPDIDYTVTERELRKRVEGISWAGISRKGSGLTVDIIEVLPEAPSLTRGLPCDLVASENGVIEEIEVLDGQVLMGVGFGVRKGDVIVSGKIVTEDVSYKEGKEIRETRISYARSIGVIRGVFTRTMDFRQPYKESVQAPTGEEHELRYISFFSAQIPLFFDVPEGSYTTEVRDNVPEIRGFSLPFGIRTLTLKGYTFAERWLDKEEAKAEAQEQAYLYEQNFLKEYELVGKSTEYIEEEDAVTLRVTYELRGVMSRERDFFIPKDVAAEEKSEEKIGENGE